MENLYKKAYDCCVKVGWDEEKLIRFSKEMFASPEEILRWGKLYQSKLVYERGPEIPNDNPILFELRGKKVKLMWEDNEEKNLVLRKIFHYCEQNQYDEQAIKFLSESFGFSKYSKKIEQYAKEYAVSYLKISSEEFEKRKEEYLKIRMKKFYQERETKSKRIMNNLLEAKTLEEIIEVIETSDTTVSSIRSLLGHYVMLHHNNDEKIEQNLRTKISMYTAYLREQAQKKKEQEERELQEKKDKENLPKAKKCIKKFLNDTQVETKEQFCTSHNIEESEFNYFIEVIQRQNVELYNQYQEKVKNMKRKSFELITKEIKLMVHLLKNGVEENGIIRPFDLIDYYMITKREVNETLKLARLILNPADTQILKLFIKKNDTGSQYNQKDIELIMKEKVEVNCKKNNNGVSIPGTGELFPEESKIKLIEFLKQNNIQVNRKTYTIAFKRYLNGYLDIETISKTR